MRLALLSDIHGNREALAAVLEDVRAVGCDRIACLGDVVGYGPDPGWCTDRVAQLAQAGAICLLGNHDAALAGSTGGGGDDSPATAMNPVARAAIDWTARQLSPAQTAFLTGLPLSAQWEGAMLTHASPESPGDWIYITSPARARGAMAVSPTRITCCGHVHIPALYFRDAAGRVAAQPLRDLQPVPLDAACRWLAVIGAVGQPRDGDPRAAWALLDGDSATLTFRRVTYDTATTAAKIRAAGLPGVLAQRIMTGT